MLIKKQFTTFLTVLILFFIILFFSCSSSSPSSSSSCDRFCSYSYSHSTTTIPPLGTPSYTQTNLNAECREANDACRSPSAVAGNCQVILLRRLVKQREQTDIVTLSSFQTVAVTVRGIELWVGGESCLGRDPNYSRSYTWGPGRSRRFLAAQRMIQQRSGWSDCQDVDVTHVVELSIGSGAATIYNNKHVVWVRRLLQQCCMTLMPYGKSKADREIAKQGEAMFSACQWLPPHDAKDAVDCHC